MSGGSFSLDETNFLAYPLQSAPAADLSSCEFYRQTATKPLNADFASSLFYAAQPLDQTASTSAANNAAFAGDYESSALAVDQFSPMQLPAAAPYYL